MRGLLLAGGHGTRLRPLTLTGNKHMLPIANEPMLFYGLHHLAAAGIRDVAIILGPIREGIEEAVGDGSVFGLRVTYVVQGEPKGLAHAVQCAKPFLGEEPFVMYLGDNLIQQGAAPLVERYHSGSVDAVVCVTPVAHPGAYGVVELEGERIVSIVEKPTMPKTNLALTGVYLFTPRIHDIIAELKPSRRGELEITDAIWALVTQGGRVAVQHVEGWWKDTGRPEDLLAANEMVLRTQPADWFRVAGRVEPGARVSGPVRLGVGSRVEQGAILEGPCVLGSDVRVENGAKVGPFAAVGDRCVLRGSSVRNSILLEGADLDGPVELSESIVGRNARIRTHSASAQLSCILGDWTEVRL